MIVHPSGSSTLYVLQLLEVDPATKVILKTIPVFTPQRAPELCGEMWEYIRRYINGAPEDLPPARIDQRSKGFFGLVLRLHEIVFEAWMRPDGTLRLGPISFFFAPFFVALSYIFIALAVWIEHEAPKRKPQPELEQANRWVGKNSYLIYDESPKEQAELRRRTLKILPFSVIPFLISVSFNTLAIILGSGAAILRF